MAKKRFIRAVIGFMSLCVFYAIINIIDFALIYAIFLYLQSLLVPFIVAVDYLFYVVRLSIPYIFMYILISLFFNLQSYKRNSTIRFLRYTVDINSVKKTKMYIYARQYNYILIITLNLFLLFIVYYAYINHKYFYLLFVMLFYVLILIVIKIKHWLFKNEKLQYKKVHMLVNLMLVVLVGTYISMTLEDLNISNVKLYGFENFWKLIDNKFFIKMPSKDFNWNRLFNWSKQTSTDHYMLAFKKSLMKTDLIDKPQEINTNIDIKKVEHDYTLDLASNLNFKEKALLSYNQNDDINLYKNVNIADYLHKTQNDDHHFGNFTNAIYQKFKKVFLIQLQIKSTNFMPTPEINERQKLFNWLKKPSNIIDLTQFYMSTESTDSIAYNDYLDLVDKKFNNVTSKKVFLITLHKNYFNFKNFVFFADFKDSFKKNYAMFLNSEKYNIDLKNNSILNFEYYNSDLYVNFDFNNLWLNFKNELYIIFKDNKVNFLLFTKKFKALYNIKSFKFSFKEDVLTDSDSMLDFKPKAKALKFMPDFKKLQVWKTFKLNYKEIIYNYTKELRAREHKTFKLENKWLYENKPIISKEPFNEIFFWVEDDIIYSLSDYIKLTQVDDLTFNTSNEYDDVLPEYISYYLENIKSSSKAFDLTITRKFTKIWINDVEKIIVELQHQRVHVPKFSSIYHEIIYQNSNEFFKYILENVEVSKDLLTSSRSLMTFDMWNALMYKLLNLNLNSMYLKNLTDFNDFCKSDFTDDLQFNFSLAFNIIQNKYDLTKLQIIPGLKNTYYEDVVKYNKQMDKLYWYEDKEDLIDWFYEISYYSLVNIMDSVKVVDGKENDFLYDMINMYLREPKYKWIAELYEHKGLAQPSKQLIILNKKMSILNDLETLKNKKELVIFKDINHFNYMEMFEKINIMNFDDVNDLNKLNWRIGRDLDILQSLLKWQLHKNALVYTDTVDDFSTLHHVDMHNNEFEIMSKYYIEDREIYNFDQGVIGGLGHCLNYHPEYPDFDYEEDFELVDDFIELRNMQRFEFFLEEMDSEMWFGYNNLLETEEFEDWLVDENNLILKKYNYILINYKEALLEANFKILNKMIYNISVKSSNLLNNDQKFNELNISYIEYEKLKCRELIQMQLDHLPIFNWYTYSFIEENVNLLMKENSDLLIKKMNLLEKQLKNEDLKLQEMKKVNKLYGKKIIKHAIKNPVNPLTKQYLEKNWDDYNYKSNKTDKLMRDWYKNEKK